MKAKLIILMALLCTYGCNRKPELKAEITNSKTIQLENPIVGSWHLCKSTGDGVDTSYNVCPTIVFSEDGNGKMKSSEKKLCDFQYVLKNDMIVFSFKTSNDKEAFFAAGAEFNFKIYIQDNMETLELSQIKTNYKFLLSRAK